MEKLTFGIDQNSDIKVSEKGQYQCAHCKSPAPYIVRPDSREFNEEVSVCGYCLHYYRMNELGENDKIIFTADLQANWISHLQKAIQAAKESGQSEKISQAECLEKWLFAHAKFVAESQWGTDDPVALDAAVERTLPKKRRLVFSELAIALSEETLSRTENHQNTPPINSWKDHLSQLKKLSLDTQKTGEGAGE